MEGGAAGVGRVEAGEEGKEAGGVGYELVFFHEPAGDVVEGFFVFEAEGTGCGGGGLGRVFLIWGWVVGLLNQQVWICIMVSFEWCQTLESAAAVSESYVSSDSPCPDRTREYSRKTSNHSSNDML